VDAVSIFHGVSTFDSLRQIRPDYFVKGGDYSPDQVLERDLVKEWGGEISLAPLEGDLHSSWVFKNDKAINI